MWMAEGWALRALALLILTTSAGWGSESPDRDCCEPLYPFIPPPTETTSTTTRSTTTTRPTTTTTRRPPPPVTTPQVPKTPPTTTTTTQKQNIPPTTRKSTSTVQYNQPGFVTTGPSSSALSCLISRQLCSDSPACAQILEILPKVCGLESVACSTPTVTKCQAALRTLQGFPFFLPTCLCKEPHLDQQCNDFREFLFDHPCSVVKTKESDPYPVDALPTCNHALAVCQQESDCISLYDNYQKACRVQNGQCRMDSWRACQSAWSQLRLSPVFGCICPSSYQSETCDQIFKTVNGNPCIDARFFAISSTSYDPIKRHSAAQLWHFWYNQTLFSNRPNDPWSTYPGHGNVGGGGGGGGGPLFEVTPTVGWSYRTDSRFSVEESASTPVYFQTSYGPRGGGVDDGNKLLQLRSTCHLALDNCERDSVCSRYLDQVKKFCDTNTLSFNCDRQKCMRAIQDFYRNIPERHSLDVAFCLCKNTPSPDEQCLRAQSLLHPVCAQQPHPNESGKQVQPVCHTIARSCKQDLDCRRRLERYDQACSVDSSTQGCAGPPEACRRAMLDILGTELRTNCGCEGSTADFRELYDCIGWHRLLWVNPCVVEAQKDYHRNRGNLQTTSFTPQILTSTTTTVESRPRPGIQTSSRPTDYGGTSGSSSLGGGGGLDNTGSGVSVSGTGSSGTDRQQGGGSQQITQYPPTPMMPTSPPVYPTPPWPKIYTTRRTSTKSTTTTTTTTTTTLPPKFCLLERPGQPVKYIREGYKKRLYKHDDPECSELCECNMGEILSCKVLECIKEVACNTGVAFYSHASPFYQAYRGQCLCYSGSFVCSKPPKDVELALAQGVYLYLGYSKKDEELLKKVTGQGALEAIGAIQGLVSYHNVNSNKSECRILLQKHHNENIVLQAVMDEFEESREKGNLTAEILNREKEECFEALESISRKINTNDADMRSHVVLSMIKVAAAEADVPDLKSSSSRLVLFKSGAPSTVMAALAAIIVFNSAIVLAAPNILL